MPMAAFWSTPAAQNFALQFSQACHQFFIFEQIVFELIYATISAIVVYFEGVGPDTGIGSSNVMILPPDVDMSGVFKPIEQVFVANLPEGVYSYIDYSGLLFFLFDIFHFSRFLFIQLLLFMLLLGDFFFLLWFEKRLLHVSDFLLSLHNKSFINLIRAKYYQLSLLLVYYLTCLAQVFLIKRRWLIYNLKLLMSDRILNELKNIKQGDKNLHQHLKQFVSQLILDRGDIAAFEAASAQQRIQNGVQESVFKVREAYSHLRDYETKHRALLAKLNSGTEEEPQEPASIGYVPDLQEEARFFEKFGLGFGEEETYRIFKSLSRLALKRNARQLRLWGKIIGSERDYYIVQGQADGGEEAGELGADVEPKGVGANKWTFWASNDLTGEWTELPIITPAQLRIARKIKYIFTGDLNRPVLTNPLFPGKESHLLKCQLVRIQTACVLVPKGSLVLNAESGEIEAPEEYQFPQVGFLAQKENWIYPNPSLLKNGRISHLKPEGLEPEEEEKWLKNQNKVDPSEPKLKSIVLDSEKWALKTYNVEEVYKTLGKNPKAVSKGVVCVKSLVWPGWATIAGNGKTSTIYVGYGHKYKQNYYPFDPEPVLQEREDRREYVVEE